MKMGRPLPLPRLLSPPRLLPRQGTRFRRTAGRSVRSCRNRIDGWEPANRGRKTPDDPQVRALPGITTVPQSTDVQFYTDGNRQSGTSLTNAGRLGTGSRFPGPTTRRVGALAFLTKYRNTKNMGRSSKPKAQKRWGRPPTGQDPVVTVRLSAKLRKSINAWAIGQSDNPSRSEAIRRLLEQALAAAASSRRGDRTARASRAEKMAGEQIDRMLKQSDQPDAVKAKRKNRLIKGPIEFRRQ